MDRQQSLYEQVELALRGGATCVQLREKKLAPEAFLAEAKEMLLLCRHYGVPLIITTIPRLPGWQARTACMWGREICLSGKCAVWGRTDDCGSVCP